MTRVDLLENMRSIIGLYVVDVLHYGNEPFKEQARFTLFTLEPSVPMQLYEHDSGRVDARFFNMGETVIWLAVSEADAKANQGLPLEPVPKGPEPIEGLNGSVEGFARRPCGGSLALTPAGTYGPMYALSKEGSYLLVIERR